MGREAECVQEVGSDRARGKVLLEAAELIIRGDLRRRIPLSELVNLRVEGDWLAFEAASIQYRLDLGAKSAGQWLQAIQKPAPTLAQKLGLTPSTTVWHLGSHDSSELATALASAAGVNPERGELAIAQVAAAHDLQNTLLTLEKATPAALRIWIVFQKGANSPFGEAQVMQSMRAGGWRDTKVASVSSILTALRFDRTAAT